ncbi:hypothetical protein BT96DRAFT_850054 [Gymnopus androsaceus JB14]|uniref:SMP-30/Gluconolactonase/LRE-like region domain-containing protein n=1 Tax=Gymnopus androsaceus JB14 TaxID=1447944 RepID=A0A6A4IBC1_9AGAR|nr:hypothetical protein BT96DRAFT_850054 [Gymnopus androsaceus JB14]
MYLSLRIAALLSVVAGSFSTYTAKRCSEHNATVQPIHIFPNGTSLESLAVRANGQILATVITTPDLYLINPTINSSVSLIHTFPGYTSLLGIVEVELDQFYVIAGNFSFAGDVSTTGSYSVFHVDMGLYLYPALDSFVRKVADFPDGQLLNGLGLLCKEKGLVYIADSYAGVVRLLNVYTGGNHVAINDTLTQPATDGLGVNGVHVSPDSKYLYFTNTNRKILARVPIHPDGRAIGQAKVVASDIPVDDFTFDRDGNVILALNSDNEIGKIDVETGDVMVLAGSLDSTLLEDPTMVRFGRRGEDKRSVYVSRNGGIGEATQVGGGVLRIDLGELA